MSRQILEELGLQAVGEVQKHCANGDFYPIGLLRGQLPSVGSLTFLIIFLGIVYSSLGRNRESENGCDVFRTFFFGASNAYQATHPRLHCPRRSPRGGVAQLDEQ